MTRRQKLTAMALSIVALVGIGLLSLDRMGIGPNLGLPVGYYGRFNRVLARIEASPEVEVVETTLHRDTALEDFYITVRTQESGEVRLNFEEAHTRPFDDLLQELKRVGL